MTHALRPALVQARTFEATADLTLRAVLDGLGATLRPLRPLRPVARILRAVLYLREGAHWRLRRHDPKGGPDAPPPSLSAWRALSEAGAPLLIDVLGGVVHGGAAGPCPVGESTSAALLHREVTHLLVLPLTFLDPRPQGMLSIELHTEGELSPALLDLAALAGLLDIAAPFLLSRPAAQPPPRSADPAFPAMGPRLAAVLARAEEAAALDDPILITGESGTGKTTLARWLHQRSSRHDKPFKVARLHEQPEGLMAGHLFGWVRGAFSGAVRDNGGVLGEAGDGTLFIDEVDKLPLDMQRRLLGLLDDGRYQRLGSPVDRSAGARIVLATNRELRVAVDEGTFLPDLRWRIEVLPLHLPPLRERPEELGAWATHFLREAGRARTPPLEARLGPDTDALLRAAPWPGNLRALESTLKRALIDARLEQSGAEVVTVQAAHLRRHLPAAPASDLRRALDGAAAAWAAAAPASGASLALPQSDVFRDLVLLAAVERLGVVEGFGALGLEKQVQNDNHQRALAKARKDVAAFFGALGEKL